MDKYFTVTKKPSLEIGHKYGYLTIISEPYYVNDVNSGKHRRQHFDCKCDCGNIKEFVNSVQISSKREFMYCSRSCEIYLNNLPTEPVNKLCKLGEIYNELTIVKEAIYAQLPGESYRSKVVEAKCSCGIIKQYREDKVFKNKIKSCGCIKRTYKKSYTRNRSSWRAVERTYGITKQDYLKILDKQNGVCAICKSDSTKNKIKNYFCIDHCHTTNKIRGLLCNKCNWGLGHFEDNIEYLSAAIDYLSKS